MNNKLIIVLIALFIFPCLALAQDPAATQESMKFELQMNLNTAQMSLQDQADNIYIGDVNKSGIGIGAHTFLLFPLGNDLSWGPNFNFTYEQINNNNWYSFDIYHLSVGPALKYYIGENPYYIFANYDLGYLVTEQEISSVSGYPAPAGNFAANLRGFIFGIRGQWLGLSDYFTVGPYFTYSMPTIMAFTYNTSFSGGPATKRWVDINTSFMQFGLSIAYK